MKQPKRKIKPVSMPIAFAEWLDKQNIPNFSELVCDLLKVRFGNQKELSEEERLNNEFEDTKILKNELNKQEENISFKLIMVKDKTDSIMKRLYVLDPEKYKEFEDYLLCTNLITEKLQGKGPIKNNLKPKIENNKVIL